MMLLYGLMSGVSAMLRRLAEWKHARAQSAYEHAADAFGELETSCKAQEVALGRPVDYAAQLRLLKAYELRESQKQRWLKAAARVNRNKQVDGKLRSFREVRLPYTFGLIDMACVLRVLDHFGVMPQIEQPVLEALYAMLSH
ncbi:MAG: hypothetical protein R3C19_01135 [Planctomycetaceae bacterium]